MNSPLDDGETDKYQSDYDGAKPFYKSAEDAV